MYYKQTPNLDLPASIRDKINQTLINGKLIATEHAYVINDNTNTEPAEILEGFTLPKEIEQEIICYYKSFLKLIPEIPKIIVLYAYTNSNDTTVHTDHLKKSSLTCVITGAGGTINWYELNGESSKFSIDGEVSSVPKEASFFDFNYVKDKNKITKVSAITPDNWELLLFDNNSYHNVSKENNLKWNQPLNLQDETFSSNEKFMYLLSIGFMNTSFEDLEKIYNSWDKKLD